MIERTFRKLVESYGATVDDKSSDISWTIDAPKGKVWACDFIHGLALHHTEMGSGGRSMKRDAIADCVERMAYGLIDCDDPECDICHPRDATGESTIGG